jgi:flagellar basal-body rod modification protein FlgD
MSTVNAIQNTNISNPARAASSQLGQSDYLHLMTAQLQNQDPTNPQDSTNFVAQMAQFGTVSGIGELRTEMSKLSTSLISGQSFQASSFLGHRVETLGNQLTISPTANKAQGSVLLTEPTQNISVQIKDQAGSVIKTISLGNSNERSLVFNWDGTTDKGQVAPEGAYTVSSTGVVSNRPISLLTATSTEVNSISMGNGSTPMQLNLANGTSTTVSNILKVL